MLTRAEHLKPVAHWGGEAMRMAQRQDSADLGGKSRRHRLKPWPLPGVGTAIYVEPPAVGNQCGSAMVYAMGGAWRVHQIVGAHHAYVPRLVQHHNMNMAVVIQRLKGVG